MINFTANVTESDRKATTEWLDRNGIKYAQVRSGNGAVWVSHGRVDTYLIIRDGKVVSSIVD